MKVVLLSVFLVANALQATVFNVGPTRTYKYCSDVVSLVRDGDTVNIDAADYTNDKQVQWTANHLLIRGVAGRPRLFAGSIIANDASNGKGIFVIKGNNCVVDNIEFRDARVMSHNGAGIRQEGLDVLIKNCVFNGNEMGILAGGYIPGCTITVEYCVFLNGGSTADPGYQHNIYINHVDTFIFRYNFCYDAIAQGHELKSRADKTFILYNRISNFSSEDSRNIDIPNGGTAVILGNVIEQGPNSSNTNIIGYGLEGLINPGPHNLWISSNTIVNRHTKGSFVQVSGSGTDTLLLWNNILAGPKTGGLIVGSPALIDSSHNFITDMTSDVGFVDNQGLNYKLTATSPALNVGKFPVRKAGTLSLIPEKEYRDTCQWDLRTSDGLPDIGAYESSSPARIILIPEQPVLYPNPATDHVFALNTQGLDHWQLTDIHGRTFQIQLQNGSLYVGHLPKGLYVLSAIAHNKQFSTKLFIVH